VVGASSNPTVGAGLVAVLFSDVVQSTELWVRLGEVRADELRRRLRSSSDRVVAASHGTVVKDTGDGIMATFPTASACIDAAVELQRVSTQVGRASGVSDLQIRVGASIGEATREAEDWFGTPVIEAARLCAAADAGQILVHDTIALLARRAEHEARPLGTRPLKGLPEPVPIREIPWAVAPSSQAALPPMLRLPQDALPFVGRSSALAALQRARTKMTSEHLVVVSGEPGVGKTRLVSEFASDWGTAGGLVLGTWFSESGESFVRSVTRLLRQLADVAPPPSWSVPLLDRLTGAVTATGQDVDPATVGDLLADWIRGCVADRPALVVLDDLHWAPQAALTLLEAMLEGLGEGPVLVVGTYRDTDLDRKHPLAGWLASRRRNERPDRIDLHGLGFDDIIGLTAGSSHAVEPQLRELCEELFRETEGNAFFVGQMIEHLRETGVLVGEPGRMAVVAGAERLGLPQGVRELVGRRLGRLPDGSEDVLALAAVQGRSFSIAVTTTALSGGTDRVVEVFDTATRAGLIEPIAGSLDRLQFVHAIVRETLLDELPALRRCRLHLDIGRALDALTPRAGGLAALDIARHFLEGAALGGLPRAVDLIERDAYTWYDHVGELLALIDGALAAAAEVGLDDRRLVQLHRLFALAASVFGDRKESGRDSFRTAVALARATGDTDLLAETASFAPFAPFGIDPELTALAAEVLPFVPPTSAAALQLRTTVNMMAAMIAPPGVDPAAEAFEILRLAELHGIPLNPMPMGPAVHWSADLARLRRSNLGYLGNIWAAVREGLRVGQAVVDDEIRLMRRAAPLQRAILMQAQSLLALARGDIDESARLTDLVQEYAGHDPMVALGVPSQRAAQARWRGDLATEEALLRPILPFLPYPRMLALAEAGFRERAGDRSGARAEFDRAWADGPHTLGRDWFYTLTLSLFAELAVTLELPERCGVLESLLTPYDGQFLLTTCTELVGSAAWYLGGLARTQGRIDDAVAHYERALAFETANGAVLMAARTRADLDDLRSRR
jgi:class 3 adenylate cyclase